VLLLLCILIVSHPHGLARSGHLAMEARNLEDGEIGRAPWCSGGDSLPPRPEKCPTDLIGYEDWRGAGLNNAILALTNALWVSHAANRTLLLSPTAFTLLSGTQPGQGGLFEASGITKHFCVAHLGDARPEGANIKIVKGMGQHSGQDMFRLSPPQGFKRQVLPLLLLYNIYIYIYIYIMTRNTKY